jgi:hypothetical protein
MRILRRLTGPSTSRALLSVVLWFAMMGAGTTLLAEGLRNWRTYAVRHQGAVSLAPIPVGGRFASWAPLVERNGLSGRWYVITTGEGDAQVLCNRLRQLASTARLEDSILALNVSGADGPPVRSVCPGRDGRPSVGLLSYAGSAISSSASGFLTEGFVVADRDFRIVYGSVSDSDLGRVPRLLSLFSLPE